MAHAGVGLSLSVFVALFAQKLDGLAEFLLRDRARVVTPHDFDRHNGRRHRLRGGVAQGDRGETQEHVAALRGLRKEEQIVTIQ